jgi:hypothetical protein
MDAFRLAAFGAVASLSPSSAIAIQKGMPTQKVKHIPHVIDVLNDFPSLMKNSKEHFRAKCKLWP